MSFDICKIYDLLPAIYRLRDSEQGGPLEALVSVIAAQAALLEDNLEQLYDDQFIETCADWVIPYIGDLIGYRTIHGVAPVVSSSRAEVANTVAYRRRKGTASMLEQLARDVIGWDARVVEFFQRLATTQAMNHIRPGNLSLVSLKQWEPLENLNTPFDTMAHMVDVRRIGSRRGVYNISNIGIFLWRLQAYPLTESPAAKLTDDAKDHRHLFHPLGIDTQLFGKPEREREISRIAERMNVPMAISRRVLSEYLDDYYGAGKSLLVIKDGRPVDSKQIVVCNLSDTQGGEWAHRAPEKNDVSGTPARVAVDPVLGRIAFPDSLKPAKSVAVTFHYGFSTELGGGEYERAATFEVKLDPPEDLIRVPDDCTTLYEAFQAASKRYADGRKNAAIEITDNGRYEETIDSALQENQRIELRAANGRRPTIVLKADWKIYGREGAELLLNGLLVSGGGLTVSGDLKHLGLSHCSLAPGPVLHRGEVHREPDKASLVVSASDATVEIRHCITGALRVDCAEVFIENGIVDATDPTRVAYAGIDGAAAGAVLNTANTTIIGKVHTIEMRLATNTIFWSRLAPADLRTPPVRCAKLQSGCVRFSFLPLDSLVPRRYRCQPDLEIETQIARAEKIVQRKLSGLEREAIVEQVRPWLVPHFTALQYGLSGYAQLGCSCPVQIRTGADDESEMGVFHDLHQPQRESDLITRLQEYLRPGLEAGIFYVS